MKITSFAFAGAIAAFSAFGATPQVRWHMQLEKDGEKKLIEVESLDQENLVVEGGRVVYGSLKSGKRTFDIKVTIEEKATALGKAYSGSVENNEKGVRVVRFNGPTMAKVGVDPAKASLYYAHGFGRRIRNFPLDRKDAAPWSAAHPAFMALEIDVYPCRALTMPWVALDTGNGTWYAAVHDARARTKTIGARWYNRERELDLRFRHPISVRTGERWEMPETVFEKMPGDWHDAAKRYRAWYDSARPAVMSAAPDWTRDLTGWLLVIMKQQNEELMWPYTDIPKLCDVAERNGLNCIGLFGWTVGGHDHLYPDYNADPKMGGVEALKAGIAEAHRRGIRVCIYANGQLQQVGATKFWDEHGKNIALTRRNGSMLVQTYHKYKDIPVYKFALGCLYGKAWSERMKFLAHQAEGFGADAILYDQQGVMRPFECWGEGHGHPVPWHSYAEERPGFLRGIADDIRKKNPSFSIFTEGLHDSILDTIGFYHSWTPGCTKGDALAVMDRDAEKPAKSDPFPELFRYTFPETAMTIRFPTPMEPRFFANYAAVFGLRHEIEIRYMTDRTYVLDGKVPQRKDYGTVKNVPDVGEMQKTPQNVANAYLKSVCDFQRKHAKYLLRGKFVDEEGFSSRTGCQPVQNGQAARSTNTALIAKRFVAADGTSAVCVWNISDKPVSVDIAGLGKPTDVFAPEGESTDGQLSPDSLRLYVYGAKACTPSYAPAPIAFDTPAANEKGIMVLGNGEVGATAWLDAGGTLHTVLQNSDSWNEGGRHVKTGAIDYETKCPVDAGTYRQELSMERGEFEASWKSGGKVVSLRYRIQQGTDSIAVCDVKGAPAVEAKVVNWRLYPGGSKVFGVGEYELGNRFCEGGPYGKVLWNKKFTISADRLVPGGWCHVNRNATVAELMKVYDFYQATGDLGKPDLLSDRAFGGVTRRMVGASVPLARGRAGRASLPAGGGRARSPSGPQNVLFLTAVTCLHPCKDETEWLRRTNEMLDRDGWTPEGEPAKRTAHIAWWRAFWDRSHIDVTPADCIKPAERPLFKFPTNKKLPMSFGVDSKGGNKFLGTFASAEVELGGKVIYSGVPKALDTVGRPPRDYYEGFRFTCKFTTDHLEKPQRLLDNMTPGGRDGFLVDVYQGHVRGIFNRVHVTNPVKVVPGRETTLEVRVSKYGDAEIVVNGVSEKKVLGRPAIPLADECAAITTAYAAQRYLTACAARGRFPIRFNGSLFTISHKGDPDYRRWGSGYWWQNTRLPYYPMFAAGDIDGTDSLFGMYFSKLDFFKKRTQKYFGHDGAYFPECMQPWGDHFIGSYGPECEWKFRKDKHQYHPCHKYAWVGQLELSLMAIMRWQHTRDDAWFKANALPSILEYVRYFDGHFKLDAKGRYNMYPAQAIETWQDCTNPMTEVAGLMRVTDLLLALPDGMISADDRAFFWKVRARLPNLPTRTLKDGGVVFAPAERFARHGNVETPELYCVFPFRLSSFEKSNAEIGRRTYTDGRFHELYFGWAQDELNAAYLGMAEEARVHIVERAVMHTPTLNRVIGCNEEKIAERGLRPSEYRWPAYWGPNYNWCPDQDEGGVFQNTIQSMLMQYEGDKIFLLPAWPKEWNCSFKLHAPRNTTVEGRVENGELKDLVVTPASRRADVVVCTKDN